MSSSISYDPSVHSSASKKTWREAGMSSATSASTGIANLLRSASKKSTSSLKSFRSGNSRKSRSGQSQSGQDNDSLQVPPVPSIVHNGHSTPQQQKSLPPSPSRNSLMRHSTSSESSSRVINNVPEEENDGEQPYELYDLPEPSPTQERKEQSFPAPPAAAPTAKVNATTPAAHVNGGSSSNNRQDTVVTPTQESTSSFLAQQTNDSSVEKKGLSRSDTLKSSSTTKTEGPGRFRRLMRPASRGNISNDTKRDEQRPTSPSTPTAPAQAPSQQPAAAAATTSSEDTVGQLPSRANMRLTPSKGNLRGARSTLQPTAENGEVNAGSAGTQWAGEKTAGGDGNTIAQLYAVFGLPKDPSVWTLAEEDCVAGVHHSDNAVGRFWRPEVLGCSICPSPAEVLSKKASTSATDQESGASKWNGRDSGGKKPNNPKFIEMSDGRGGAEKAETARVLSKALKLSFTREIEIIAEQGNYPPTATSHTFSFSVPTISASSSGQTGTGGMAAGSVGVSVGKMNAASGVGEGFGLDTRGKAQGASMGDLDDGPSLATFYGVVLTVWSAADEKRAKMIRKELTRAAKQRGGSSSTAATSKGSKRGAPGANGSWMDGSNGTGEGAGGGEEEDDRAQSPSLNHLPANSTFFMPYAICIVSRFPLYNLLGDWNKMAWHKYSRNIEMHNQLMSTILRHPAPRLGEEFSVGSPDKDLSFHCTFPGAMEWGTGLISTDMTMWPLFKTLSLDNILTVCEIALANNGRILFQSRHPALLGLAVETIKHLVESCGWRGVANQNCHARDVKIYLEDPGSYIIAINSELRSIIKPAKEVCLVDLDINFVNCPKPPAGAISTRQVRDKKRRRLMQAIFVSNVECSPPREFVEAYPGGRFRPLSKMVTREANSAYEQLGSPKWWNESAVIQTFDKVLREGNKPTFLKMVLKSRNNKANNVSEAELAAILALRKRASTFVDARDGLENKIGRLNKRLAFLMSESEMWRAQFGKIQLLVDRLTKEANDLRSKVDKERRESKRLSSTLAQRDIEQVQIQLQLKETESAREEAQAELMKMQRAMESLETEREAMMEEIRAVLSGSGGVEDVNLSLSRLDLPLTMYNPLAGRSESPTGSQASMTPSQAAEFILKSRAAAEAKINEGRPGRQMSRAGSQTGHGSSNGHVRSMSHDRGERSRKEGSVAHSAQHTNLNHFPDDQMNYEIQQRTSVVTSQISKIQAQLESTLTQLEGRRSGTYERENERRMRRRGSNASINSRYEYRTPSSLGHGGGMGAADSSIGHGSEDGRSVDYEQIESVKGDAASISRRRRKDRSASAASVNSVSGDLPSSRSNTFSPLLVGGLATPSRPVGALTPSNSNGSMVNSARQSPSALRSPASMTGSVSGPSIAPKSQARQRDPSNPWKEAANDVNSSKKNGLGVNGQTDGAATEESGLSSDSAPPAYSNEVMLGEQGIHKVSSSANRMASDYESTGE